MLKCFVLVLCGVKVFCYATEKRYEMVYCTYTIFVETGNVENGLLLNIHPMEYLSYI